MPLLCWNNQMSRCTISLNRDSKMPFLSHFSKEIPNFIQLSFLNGLMHISAVGANCQKIQRRLRISPICLRFFYLQRRYVALSDVINLFPRLYYYYMGGGITVNTVIWNLWRTRRSHDVVVFFTSKRKLTWQLYSFPFQAFLYLTLEWLLTSNASLYFSFFSKLNNQRAQTWQLVFSRLLSECIRGSIRTKVGSSVFNAFGQRPRRGRWPMIPHRATFSGFHFPSPPPPSLK